MLTVERPLPHDTDAERALLGSILVRPDTFPKLAQSIEDWHFYHPGHRRLWDALRSVADEGNPPDWVFVRSWIDANVEDEQDRDDFRKVAWDCLHGMEEGHWMPSSAPAYAKRVQRTAVDRRALRAVDEVAQLAAANAPAEEIAAVMAAVAKHYQRNGQTGQQLRAIDLATLQDGAQDPIPWVLEGWLAEAELAWFGGEWGTGKSLIALDLAVSIAAGISWLGRVPSKPGRVLVIDEENGQRLARHRMRLILAGRNLDPATWDDLPIRYVVRPGLNLNAAVGQAALRREVESFHANVVLLDSFQRLTPGLNPNKSAEFNTWAESCVRPLNRELGAAVVVLDHMRKPTKDDKDVDTAHRIAGTQDKNSNADEVWTLEGDRQTDSRTFSHRKTRWDDLQPDLTTRWVKSEDGTAAWIEATEADRSNDAVVIGILAAALDEGLRASEVYSRAGERSVSKFQVVRTLKRLQREGGVKSRPEGRQGIRYWASKHAPLGAK